MLLSSLHSTAEQFITQYGYWAVFVGSLIEGEGIALLGGAAAHQGYLRLPFVTLLVCLGGALGDQCLYFAGRHWGPALLARLHTQSKRIDHIRNLVTRHEIPVVLGVRFMYGFRLLGPLVIGASGIPPQHFVALNIAGALLWAMLVTGVGYAAGHMVQHITQDLHNHRLHVLAWTTLATLAAIAIRLALSWHARRKADVS